MRVTFTFILLLFVAAVGYSQINDESPYPVDFEALAPNSIVGIYDYGTQVGDATNPIWGPTLSETVSGEIVWAYDATDSLVCDAVVTDLTGKFALIRRGTCGFVNKVFNAQQAGAIGVVIVNHYNDPAQTGATIVGMLGGDGSISSQVTIPAVFVGRTTGEILDSELSEGNPVTVSFTVKSFYDPIASFSYHTPLSSALAVDAFRANFLNTGDSPVDVSIQATITSPSGEEESLVGTSNVASLADSVVLLDGSYLPTELGEYTVEWTNDQSTEVLTSTFVMTEHTFAVDNGDLSLSAGPSEAQFAAGSLVYQVGGIVLTNGDGAVASYASFGLANGAEIFTGDANADQILVILYDADADNNNTIDFAAAGATFDDLTPVALGTYLITGTETGDLVYVELEDLADGDNLVELKPGGAYYITISYDGTEAGLGIAPRFVASAGTPYINYPTTPLFLDQLYTGWAGLSVAVRLHLDGFVLPTSTEEVTPLADAKVELSPNPVRNMLNISFELDNMADRVVVGMFDMNGKLLGNYEYRQVANQTVQVDVNQLPAGTYFLSIVTPEGAAVEKFTKFYSIRTRR